MEPRAGMPMTPQLVIGMLLATIGVLFMLDNLHILPQARLYARYWPVAFVAIGALQVAQARTSAGTVGGAIWILLGVTMLGNRIGLWRVSLWDFWPMVLVIVGGRIVWQAYYGGGAGDVEGGSMTSAIAVMGGVNRKIVSQEFRGAELTAFMGGGKLDLRDAGLAGGQAVVNVFAMMGGFEILVPDTWQVIVEATPIMGGTDIKARTSTNPTAPRLVIRGFVMMGGVDVKN